MIFYRVYLYDKLDQVAGPIIGIGPTARSMPDHYVPIHFDTIGKDTCLPIWVLLEFVRELNMTYI